MSLLMPLVYYIEPPGEPYSYDPTGADGLGFTNNGGVY